MELNLFYQIEDQLYVYYSKIQLFYQPLEKVNRIMNIYISTIIITTYLFIYKLLCILNKNYYFKIDVAYKEIFSINNKIIGFGVDRSKIWNPEADSQESIHILCTNKKIFDIEISIENIYYENHR